MFNPILSFSDIPSLSVVALAASMPRSIIVHIEDGYDGGTLPEDSATMGTLFCVAALTRLSQEIGVAFVTSELITSLDVSLWLAGIVPWHVAKYYEECKHYDHEITLDGQHSHTFIKGNGKAYRKNMRAIIPHDCLDNATAYHPNLSKNVLARFARTIRDFTYTQ